MTGSVDWAALRARLQHRQPYDAIEDWRRHVRSGAAPPPAVQDAVADALARIIDVTVDKVEDGTAHKGMITRPGGYVSESWPAHCGAELLAHHPLGAAAALRMRLALRRLEGTLEAGTCFFEYDRPGYDEVTEYYRALLSHQERLDWGLLALRSVQIQVSGAFRRDDGRRRHPISPRSGPDDPAARHVRRPEELDALLAVAIDAVLNGAGVTARPEPRGGDSAPSDAGSALLEVTAAPPGEGGNGLRVRASVMGPDQVAICGTGCDRVKPGEVAGEEPAGAVERAVRAAISGALADLWCRYGHALSNPPAGPIRLRVQIGGLDPEQRRYVEERLVPGICELTGLIRVSGPELGSHELGWALLCPSDPDHHGETAQQRASRLAHRIARECRSNAKARCSLWKTPLHGLQVTVEVDAGGGLLRLDWRPRSE